MYEHFAKAIVNIKASPFLRIAVWNSGTTADRSIRESEHLCLSQPEADRMFIVYAYKPVLHDFWCGFAADKMSVDDEYNSVTVY